MSVVEQGHEIGKMLSEEKVTKSQLRKFLSAVNSIQNKAQIVEGDILTDSISDEIQQLRVKLAYQTGRELKKLSNFQKQLDTIIKNIGNSKQKWSEFARLMETIVAYHKFEGGKE